MVSPYSPPGAAPTGHRRGPPGGRRFRTTAVRRAVYGRRARGRDQDVHPRARAGATASRRQFARRSDRTGAGAPGGRGIGHGDIADRVLVVDRGDLQRAGAAWPARPVEAAAAGSTAAPAQHTGTIAAV